ncbi:MAG TPA: molybdenum cofactor guanylyltransferase [Methanoregulaceae archaeon]|nr:molybdenum cofactor guanylyltransferase [Methanoregulaceae archaeon]
MKTAIILVGGEAKRAQGREKYFFVHDGKTFIERLLETLSPAVDEIILVARDPRQCERFSRFSEVICVHDIRKGLGPIGGIHAGVIAAKGDSLFISGCDMPLVNRDIVVYLFSLLDGYDAVIPAWDTVMFEPLHAVYRKAALLRYLDSHESLSLRDMIRSLNARFVGVENLKKYDPCLTTFVNINKLEDLNSINGDVPGN